MQSLCTLLCRHGAVNESRQAPRVGCRVFLTHSARFSCGTGMISALAFSPDGQMLATGGHDRSVRLFNAVGQQVSLRKTDVA